ncbi:MAG: glycosyl transferase [Desulfobulbaceae bacterium A2]|nr:MAG: glycosyl transferase [Desulfobulbaceae bacterium A2]
MSVSGIPSNPAAAPRLGAILLARGKITEAQLREALTIQQERGGRLGWLLLTLGFISRLDLFRALASHFSLKFVVASPELLELIDRKLLADLSSAEAIAQHVIPLARRGNTLVVLTDFPDRRDLDAFCRERFQVDTVRRVLVTDLDFMNLIQQLYGDELIDQSINGLFYRNSQESAYSVFTKTQILVLGLFCYAALTWLYLDVKSFLIALFALCQLTFFVSVTFKLVISLAGARREQFQFITNEEVAALDDSELPVYTVLVPVYKEPEVIRILINSLKKVDYPQGKLDILLLLEEEDTITFEAAKKAQPPGNWRFIRIPNALPKTKPKACNYGVFFSRGAFLTIYDAEDIPEPDQLKKAIIGFRKYGESYVCLQAALNYFNADENVITRLFTLEYSYWFDYLLPGLDRFQLPIPLGGTSNHFRTDILKQLGAWDPYNVTEDADLGIRACANGYRVGVINSTTYEEANTRYGNWLRQRSRWIKGYMQTFLVYNRRPFKMLRTVGLINWLSFQLFIGGTPLLFLVTPLAWGVFLFWLLTHSTVLDPFMPPFVLYIGLYNLLIGNFMGIYLNMMAVFRRGLFSLLPFAMLNPLYWLLGHSVSAYKALWQLFSKPFYWEKTAHGISKLQH